MGNGGPIDPNNTNEVIANSLQDQVSLLQELIALMREMRENQIQAARDQDAAQAPNQRGSGAPSGATRSPITQATPAPAAQSTPPPTARQIDAPRDLSSSSGKSISDTLNRGLKELAGYLTRNIEQTRPKVAADDYQIGQMSRRSLDYNQQTLQSYRQRIYDLGQRTGMSLEESKSLAFMSNRYGLGTSGGVGTTSTGRIGSFDQGEQARIAAESAFGLGLNRKQYFSTLQSLGQAGAVGAAGQAGGQNQDYRQFATTIAETLATGRLFDRMDDVMASIGTLADNISSRGGIVDPQMLANAIASANLAAMDSGSARLQERAPRVLQDIGTFSASQMNDPLSLAMNMKSGLLGGGGVSTADVLKSMDIMAGGDINAQSQSFMERFKTFGGDVSALAGNKTADQLDIRSQGAIFAMSQLQGQSPQQIMDMLRISGGVASDRAGQSRTQLQGDANYQALLAKPGNEQAAQLYARAKTASGAELTSLMLEQAGKLERLSPASIRLSGTKENQYYTRLQTQIQQAQNGNVEGARSEFLKSLGNAPASLKVGGENQLESFAIQTRELGIAFETLAGYVNQTSAALGINRGEAFAYRFAAGQGASDYADPALATEMGTGANWYQGAAVSEGMYLPGKMLADSDGKRSGLGGFFADLATGATRAIGGQIVQSGGARRFAGRAARGVGIGLAGLGLEIGGDLLDEYAPGLKYDSGTGTPDEVKVGAGSLARIAGWGITGAGAGSIFSPVGTAIGGAGGAAYGLYDEISSGRMSLGSVAKGATDWIGEKGTSIKDWLLGANPTSGSAPTGGGSETAAQTLTGNMPMQTRLLSDIAMQMNISNTALRLLVDASGKGGQFNQLMELATANRSVLPSPPKPNAPVRVPGGQVTTVEGEQQQTVVRPTVVMPPAPAPAPAPAPGSPTSGNRPIVTQPVTASIVTGLKRAGTAAAAGAAALPDALAAVVNSAHPLDEARKQAGNVFSAVQQGWAKSMPAQGSPALRSEHQKLAPYMDIIEKYSQETGIPKSVVAGLIEQESSWDNTSYRADTQASGFGQITPIALQDLKQRGKISNDATLADLRQPGVEGGRFSLNQSLEFMKLIKSYEPNRPRMAEGYKNLLWYYGEQSPAYLDAVDKKAAQYAYLDAPGTPSGGGTERPIALVNAAGTNFVSFGSGADQSRPTSGFMQYYAGTTRPNIGEDWTASVGQGVAVPESGVFVSLQHNLQEQGSGLNKTFISGDKTVAPGYEDPAGTQWTPSSGEWGNSVGFLGDSGTFHRFSHLQANVGAGLQVGQKLQAGTVIGQVGTSGRSTGPHLDWQTQHKDASGNWKLIASSAWRHGQLEFAGNANIAGISGATKVPEGGVAPAQGGGSDISGGQQVQLVIRLEQDENGKINGTLVSAPTAVLAFNKQDPLSQNFQTQFRLNPVIASAMP